jgi:hypothetical protein
MKIFYAQVPRFDVQIHAFLALLSGLNDQVFIPPDLLPEKECILLDADGPRASMYLRAKMKVLFVSGLETRQPTYLIQQFIVRLFNITISNIGLPN